MAPIPRWIKDIYRTWAWDISFDKVLVDSVWGGSGPKEWNFHGFHFDIEEPGSKYSNGMMTIQEVVDLHSKYSSVEEIEQYLDKWNGE